MIRLGADKKNSAFDQLFRELPERMRAVQAEAAQRTAQAFLAHLLEKIPSKPEWASYRKSLQVVRVNGLPEGQIGFVVRAHPKKKQITKDNAQRHVLYIKSKPRLAMANPGVQILAQFSPWTLDTLPFKPKDTEAKIYSRKVREGEQKKISAAREADRPQWEKALSLIHLKPGPKVEAVRASPQIGFEALRLEFGMGGERPKAHWRPATQRAQEDFPAMLRRDRDFQLALTSLGFKGWKAWPTAVANSIPAGQAADYQDFMTKIS